MANVSDLELDLTSCDSEVRDKGRIVRFGETFGKLLDELRPKDVEEIVKSAAKRIGSRVDWHYMNGKVFVKTLGDPVLTGESLASEYWREHGFPFGEDFAYRDFIKTLNS